jgi:hypothetical protein
MPIERSDTTSETDNLMIRHYNQPGSDESDSEGARNKQKKSKQKQKNNELKSCL